jgi:transcriptional regulator with XRE-family HTH domain
MDFWERLRDRIKESDLKQDWVAQKIRVPVGTFKNWLTRRTYPNAQQIVDIAKVLNTSSEYLLTGTDRGTLNEDESRLLTGFRQLSKCDQGHIEIIVDAWVRRYKGK